MNKKIVILVGCTLLLVGCGTANKEIDVSKISHDEVISCEEKDAILKSDSNAHLIDVRTEAEYQSGHLDKAENIAVGEIDSIKDMEDIKSDTPIIVYCRSGSRSATAASKLKELGYTNVYDLGAMDNCN